MKKYILLYCLLSSAFHLWAQTTGGLYGKVTDKIKGEGLVAVNLVLMDGNTQVAVSSSDLSGNYNISNIKAGTYSLVALYLGYPNTTINELVISADQNLRVDIEMAETVTMDDITITHKKIIDTKPNKTIRDATFIQHSVERGLINVIKSSVDIKSRGNEKTFSSIGSRTSSNLIMINGIPTLSTSNVPIADLEVSEIQVMTSNIPARYGDATGSVTNIITKGPSTRLTGGAQLESSQFLDNFGAITANAFMSGPILSHPIVNALGDTLKREGKVVKSSILGYRFSGAYSTILDDSPSALNTFKLDAHKLKDVLDNPLVHANDNQGMISAADFLKEEDILASNIRSNARNSSVNYTTVLEYKPSSEFFIALSSEGQFKWGKRASITNQLFNAEFNPNIRDNNLNFTLRFRHIVLSTEVGNQKNEKENKKTNSLLPVFQNLSYQLTGGYTMNNFNSQDPRYNDFWEYGYVGKFYESRRPVIDVIQETPIYNSKGDIIGYKEQIGHTAFFNSFDAYEPNLSINPGLAAYNKLIPAPIDWRNPTTAISDVPSTSLHDMEIINGSINNGRSSAYGLFSAPHITQSGFSKFNSNQIRANVQTNFELYMNQRSGNPVRHKIELGGVFEQKIQRSYRINPFKLWSLAYQSANTHLSNATDINRPTGEQYYDPIRQRNFNLYEALIRKDEAGNEVAMSNFGRNLRQSLGVDKRDWVAVHELTPEQMDMSWFAPSTLITGQQGIVGYFGYDYLGNPLSTKVSFNDFFFAKDKQGRKTHPVAAFKPIYVAGYIQDEFIFKDMVFNVGVRFDSYDANTRVLKDPYSITGYETAAEFESSNSIYNTGQSPNYKRPSNIGDGFAVYVNSNSPDAKVVGYRSGHQWYNASGSPVNNASELGAAILPALKGFSTSEIDPQGERYNPNEAFEDYKPTLVIMPRLSFAFPINKTANFYASYNILSQRPSSNSFASALNYYNFRATTANGRSINNPNLKPERTINYEVGFQQALSPLSKITLGLVYKEERNLIQQRQYINAYPNTYTTYGNDDFSTTKGLKLEYETFRSKGLKIIANYMLQFSEGTGSNPNSSTGVAARELKYIFPLNFDQRHAIFVNLDYRFQSKKKYEGPRIRNFPLLANMGFSVSMNAYSGYPYTRKKIAGGIDGSFSNRLTDGSINGARMPWGFRLGFKIDRNFVLGKNSRTPLTANVFLRISNLFNTQNVVAVYPVTGSPTDDGFLSNEQGLGFASSKPDSYELLYNLRMRNPRNISVPRRIFLGFSIFF